MEILELKYNDRIYTNKRDIINTLKSNEFYWLIDSEIADAVIEIKNNTLIWHDGIFMTGDWHYGIFKNGEFYGNWENGIWESGLFKGYWKSGLK
jgi:hypothetical protein